MNWFKQAILSSMKSIYVNQRPKEFTKQLCQIAQDKRQSHSVFAIFKAWMLGIDLTSSSNQSKEMHETQTDQLMLHLSHGNCVVLLESSQKGKQYRSSCRARGEVKTQFVM